MNVCVAPEQRHDAYDAATEEAGASRSATPTVCASRQPTHASEKVLTSEQERAYTPQLRTRESDGGGASGSTRLERRREGEALSVHEVLS
jgi:hypothetical protein